MPHKDAETAKKYHREYYLRHREKALAYNKRPEVRARRIEQQRRHYWRNRDAILRSRRSPEEAEKRRDRVRRRMSDPSKRTAVNAWWRGWYARNKARRNAQTRERREKKPSRFREVSRKSYRAMRQARLDYAKERRRIKREERSAGTYVALAVKYGHLQRPTMCEICGAESKYNKLDAHHDDYSKPLAVRWLCRRCHKRLHHGLLDT